MTTMTMTTISLTLPKQLVEKANEKGLLEADAIEKYLRNELERPQVAGKKTKGAFEEKTNDEPYTEEEIKKLDAMLLARGIVDPETFRKGKVLGDIVSPLYTDEEWEEMWEKKWGDLDLKSNKEVDVKFVRFEPVTEKSQDGAEVLVGYAVHVTEPEDYLY